MVIENIRKEPVGNTAGPVVHYLPASFMSSHSLTIELRSFLFSALENASKEGLVDFLSQH